MDFDLTYPSTNHTYSSFIMVNGTHFPNSSTSIDDLPLGTHTFELLLNNTALMTATSGKEDWVRFNGATGHLGQMVEGETQNYTIDDTAWRDGRVILSPGWNMLEKDAWNWINTVRLIRAS
jgi:hypothetical protein